MPDGNCMVTMDEDTIKVIFTDFLVGEKHTCSKEITTELKQVHVCMREWQWLERKAGVLKLSTPVSKVTRSRVLKGNPWAILVVNWPWNCCIIASVHRWLLMWTPGLPAAIAKRPWAVKWFCYHPHNAASCTGVHGLLVLGRQQGGYENILVITDHFPCYAQPSSTSNKLPWWLQRSYLTTSSCIMGPHPATQCPKS